MCRWELSEICQLNYIICHPGPEESGTAGLSDVGRSTPHTSNSRPALAQGPLEWAVGSQDLVLDFISLREGWDLNRSPAQGMVEAQGVKSWEIE